MLYVCLELYSRCLIREEENDETEKLLREIRSHFFNLHCTWAKDITSVAVDELKVGRERRRDKEKTIKIKKKENIITLLYRGGGRRSNATYSFYYCNMQR